MLYNTKLNEFSIEQIDLFLKVVGDEIDSINNEFSIISGWSDSDIKYTKEKYLQWRFDSIILLKVQLQNAKSDIKEMANSN